MDKKEFIKKLEEINVSCMILDDSYINPNEIIVFSDCKKKLIGKLKDKGISDILVEDGKKCCIRVLSFSEIGISKWKIRLKKEAIPISESVSGISENDSIAVFLYYAFVFVQTKHWLYNSIIREVEKRLGLNCEEQIQWLASYLSERHYGIYVKKIVELPKELLQLMSPMQKVRMELVKFRLKSIRKLSYKILGKKSRRHIATTREKYIDYLLSTSVLGTEWNIINEKIGGVSGCTLIKDVRDGKAYFIKGNELKTYQGIKNEIMAQKRMMQMAGDAAWFLHMIDSDISMRWIRYDFVMWGSLNSYLKQHSFSKEELELFGQYLIDVLDNLCNMNIVHNDLRLENIMVETNDKGNVERFVLTDFGCASIENSFPWCKTNYWGKFFSRIVCGEKRYNEYIIDDAASALLIYIEAGGSFKDYFAIEISKRIGRNFFVCK